MPDRTSNYRQARVVINFGTTGQSPTRVNLMLVKVERGIPDVRLALHWDGPAMDPRPTVEEVLEMLDAFVRSQMLP